MAVPMQGECRGEPADPCPDDRDPHADRPPADAARAASVRAIPSDASSAILRNVPPMNGCARRRMPVRLMSAMYSTTVPAALRLEPDVVGSLDARSAADQDHPPRRLEDRDPVLHRRHAIALSDAEAEPRSDADLAGADAFRGRDARVPLLRVGEVREVRKRVLDRQWRLRCAPSGGSHVPPVDCRQDGCVRDLIDDVLEVTVIGSFSNIGIRTRRALYRLAASDRRRARREDRGDHRADVWPRSRGDRGAGGARSASCPRGPQRRSA